jgi:hypothetical protein
LANNRVFRLTQANTTVTFENLTIRHGNISNGQGAAIYANILANLVVNNCNITNNYTIYQGAGISVKAELTITNSSFVDNIANAAAGAVFHNTINYDATISNSLFYRNNSATHNGAALFLKSKNATLNNNTIAYNTCDAINKTEGLQYGPNDTGTLIITNNIFFNNTTASDHKDGGLDIGGIAPPNIISKNNIISYLNNSKFYDNNISGTNAAGNIVNSAGVDTSRINFANLTQATNGLFYLPIYPSSIAKDAADSATATSTDINGTPREIADIGAHEA